MAPCSRREDKLAGDRDLVRLDGALLRRSAWASRRSEGPALVEEMVAAMHALLQRDVAGRPGALELVARLRGRLPLALASNSPRRLVDAALHHRRA